MRAARRALAAVMLVLEAFVVFFAGLVAMRSGPGSGGAALALFGGLALACLVVAGLPRKGYLLGWGVQALILASGFLVTDMFFVGGIFLALWTSALYWGGRIERERAAVDAEYYRRQAASGSSELSENA